MSQVYEMQWDCQFCGTKKLLGKTHRFCPNCGATQDPKSRYYPSDEEKVAVQDHVFVGADKVCPSCSTLNSAQSEFCQNCGAPLAEAAGISTLGAETQAQGAAFVSSGSRDVTKEHFESEMTRVGVMKPKNDAQPRNWKVIGAVVAVLAVVVIGILAALFMKKEATVVAASHSWEREIRVDLYDNFTQQNWWDSAPMGDNVFRGVCVSKQRSTRQVEDGEECSNVRVDQGDGTYRQERQCNTKYRSEPVYDDWCTFTGQRWDYKRSVTTSGTSVDQTPNWGEVTPNCNGQRSIGCEQESGRNETYNVQFAGDKDIKYTCDFPQAQWETIKIESVWTVQVRVVDVKAADCATIKPKK